MWHNYLKIAARNFFKYRLTSAINILGLTIGLVVCLLIVLFVKDELSFDNFHQKADRIVLFQQFQNGALSGSNFAPLLKRKLAQVEQITQVIPHTPLLSTEEQANYENGFYFVDTAFFSIFDFALIKGNPTTALLQPNSLLLTEKMVKKYFPNEDPVGRTIKFDKNQFLTVTGILEDTPVNSHLPIEFICSAQNIKQLAGGRLNSFWDSRTFTYALLAVNTDIEALVDKLPEIAKETGDPNAQVWQLSFLSLRDIYLKHALYGGVISQKAIENVYIFSVIALLVLALACFNYVSMVTARSTVRAKEVGVRKILGANKKQLLLQFLNESTILIVLALIISLAAIQLILPSFNIFVGKDLLLSSLLDAKEFFLLLGIFLLISLFTGVYPAFALSSFNLVVVAKNSFFNGFRQAFFRKGLVVLQFTISIAMIIATVVVLHQIQFVKHKDLGYEREAILDINFSGNLSTERKQVFQQELAKVSTVKSTSFCSTLPGNGTFFNKLVEGYAPSGEDSGYSYINVDDNFLETFAIELLAGRNFKSSQKENKNKFLINETMVKQLAWEDGVIGKELGYYTYQNSPNGGYQEVKVIGEVIGLIKDYHQNDLRSTIAPMILKYGASNQNQLAVKVSTNNNQNTVETIQKIWAATIPNEPFDFSFLDEGFQNTYEQEVKTSQIFTVFSILAIFVSCLGLLGLVTFAAERRVKEIGIRKVLGASVSNIVGLLSGDFLKLVAIALIIAIPIGTFSMNKWLERFAYRIELEWWMFALAGLTTMFITLLTVGYQSVKAALSNPVQAIKSE